MIKDLIQQDPPRNFSQRAALLPVPPPLNPGELSQQVRIELEAELKREYLKTITAQHLGDGHAEWTEMLSDLAVRAFRWSLHTGIEGRCLEHCYRVIRGAKFNEVFDLIEAIAAQIGNAQPTFPKAINAVLHRSQAPYVLIKTMKGDWEFIQTGSGEDQKSVTYCHSCLNDTTFINTRTHIQRAGAALAKMDYEYATNQSVMAVEATFRSITGRQNFTLGQILGQDEIKLPPLVKEQCRNMWKYRSDADGVGHSIKDISSCPRPNHAEAQLIYSTCCATITYLINTHSKASAL